MDYRGYPNLSTSFSFLFSGSAWPAPSALLSLTLASSPLGVQLSSSVDDFTS